MQRTRRNSGGIPVRGAETSQSGRREDHDADHGERRLVLRGQVEDIVSRFS